VRYYDGEYSATVESLLVTRIDTNTDITYGITGRDDSVGTIMQSLYALSVIDLNPANEAGYRQVINRVIRDLKDGFDGVIEEIGDLGVKQLQLQETTIRQNDFITALDMQIGNVEDVDMSSALSALTATQTSLEASYRMLTLMRDMTLVKYL
jgi:flagellar hook-associated protein 3 FlgL